MKRFITPNRKTLTGIVVLAFLVRCSIPVYAQSPVKMKKFQGTIDLSADGVSTFTLEGSASHLGQFTCQGEVEFVAGEDEDTFVGEGVAIFTAANGDQLAARVTWEVQAEDGDFRTTRIHFSWADLVRFSDGTQWHSTGRFEHDRPPGLVVIAIIAILIGMLLPAI
jgi:hypothetical protein